ncbi:hypothetical protein [Methylococcus mesophilus]|uniref:hypothetical protein n=1 Tax=Methylococcus mesophilus TaxID=2993564 RepID=UPI00224A9AD0|nr:hypothetical protein [Methylococcus mesophilus]UZR30723.1 hypothetical protein OOT43_08885 [Methylococcus mesophilus]
MRLRHLLTVLSLVSVLALLPGPAVAVPSLTNLVAPLNALSTAFSNGAKAWEALSGFRGPFSPVGAAIGLGIGIGLYELCDNLNCYQYLPGENLPYPAVPGWSDPDTPPASVPGTSNYTYYDSRGWIKGTFTDPAAACVQFCANAYGPTVTECLPRSGYSNPDGSGYYDCNGPGGCNCIIAVSSASTTCGTCYVDDGKGHCLLQSACPNGAKAQWPSDGKPTYRAGRTGWVAAERDPDVGTHQDTRTGADAHANSVRETIKPTPDGGADYVRDTESVGSDGKPVVNRDQVHTDANGNVTSSTTTSYNNTTITNVDNTTGAGTTIDTSSLNQEATQQRVAAASEATKTNTDAVKQDVALSRVAVEGAKVDLAAIRGDSAASRASLDSIDRTLKAQPTVDIRGLDLEVTQQRVATATEAAKESLDNLDKKLIKDTTKYGQVPQIDDFDTTWQIFIQKVQTGPLGAMFLVSASEPSGGCVTYPVDLAWFNRAFVIDQHCTIWAEVSPTIASFMPYVWSLIAVFILFSA